MIRLLSLMIVFSLLYSITRDDELNGLKQCISIILHLSYSLIIGGLIGVMIIILSAFTMDLILIFVKKIFLED
jgi:hypothetical protein